MPTPDTLKQVKDLSRQVITFAIARVPDAERAFLGCSDFKVYEVDFSAAKPEPKELYAHESYVPGVAVALGGKVVVSGGYEGKLIWWDAEDRKTVRAVEAHAKWVRKVIPSPDGTLVASVADDMVCKLWDAESGKLVRELRGHKELTPNNFTSMLYAVAFSADGKHLATGDKVGHVVVWDAETGKEVAAVEAPVMYTWDKVQRLHSIGGVRSLAFSPDGAWLVSVDGQVGDPRASCRLKLWDVERGREADRLELAEGCFYRVVFAADGRSCYAALHDGTVRRYRLPVKPTGP